MVACQTCFLLQATQATQFSLQGAYKLICIGLFLVPANILLLHKNRALENIYNCPIFDSVIPYG